MARNEEKHAGRLNRLWLQKLDEENLRKNPPRPGLGSLHTAAAVKKWLPSIKRDIDFYLKQSQVPCYPEGQIEDFSSKIETLTKEYKAYVRKLRELDPDVTAVPWTERAYKRKRQLKSDLDTVNSKKSKDEEEDTVSKTQHSEEDLSVVSFAPVSTPLLDQDVEFKDVYGYNDEKPAVIWNSDPEFADRPLNFNTNKAVHRGCDKCSNHECNNTLRQCDKAGNVIADENVDVNPCISSSYRKQTADNCDEGSCNCSEVICSDKVMLFKSSACCNTESSLSSPCFKNAGHQDSNKCIKGAENSSQNVIVCSNLYCRMDENSSANNSSTVDNSGPSTVLKHSLNLPYSDSSSEEGE